MSDIVELLGRGIDNIDAFSEVELLDSACGRLEAALGIGQAVKYMEEAGTEIARLREENERLAKERDEANQRWAETCADFITLQRAIVGDTGLSAILRVDALKTAEAALREAVEARDKAYCQTNVGPMLWSEIAQNEFDLNEVNRAAVKEARYAAEVLEQCRVLADAHDQHELSEQIERASSFRLNWVERKEDAAAAAFLAKHGERT